MSEWIEFNRLNGEGEIYPTSVRVYSIEAVDKVSDGSCKVYMDDEHHYSYTVAESYEDIMKKIQSAEEPVAIPVAEHFTREEYEILEYCLTQYIQSPSSPTVVTERYAKLQNKLNEILKEDE